MIEMSYRGKFQGRIGRVCQYAVYQEGDCILLYRSKEPEPCFETKSYIEAEKFAGVIGYRPGGRSAMPIYAD